MSSRKYKIGICPECGPKEGDRSRHRLYQCSVCGRWFCKRHLEPRPAFLSGERLVKRLESGSPQDRAWQTLLAEATEKEERSHPDFPYTEMRWRSLLMDERRKSEAINKFLDKAPSAPKWETLPLPRRKEREKSSKASLGGVMCPRCKSNRVQTSAYRQKKIHYECLDCGKRWELYYGRESAYTGTKRSRRIAVLTGCFLVLTFFGVMLYIYAPDIMDWSKTAFSSFQLTTPYANFTMSQDVFFPDQQIVFNGSMSHDPDSKNVTVDIIEYRWNFGDGTSVEVDFPTVKHTYHSIDVFEVTLVVVDDDNQTASCTKIIETTWVIPSTSQLQTWLLTDQTNMHEYIYPSFVCADFAQTLADHARTQKYWKMGIVYIDGYEITTHEEWYHAINAIVTSEGLVYIEPQTDEVWWYPNHQPMVGNTSYKFWNYPYVTVQVFVDNIEIALDY